MPKLVFTHTSELLVITLLIITWNWRSSSFESWLVDSYWKIGI